MKTSRLLLASALLAAFSTLAFAGAGSQTWTRQAKDTAATTVQPATQVAACASCSCCVGLKKN